ncbi:hypothetical protein JYU34_016165 [Plutella xylostella]|uniref:Uncharacterized protein n=1 Tax=Plutella xylostella TaxID=51655 RepID=A0ABQ7Q5R6_PLUXY|nr:hypothetical protein JYU34_016165 [Plutella xylostella]
MSHFGDFIEGVPVKISEKYIRPPKIELPYSVSECGVRARKVLDSTQGHCCTFEQNVLAKLQELRSAKKTKKNERQHRLQLLKEEKQKNSTPSPPPRPRSGSSSSACPRCPTRAPRRSARSPLTIKLTKTVIQH